jgi:hypothetical protein
MATRKNNALDMDTLIDFAKTLANWKGFCVQSVSVANPKGVQAKPWELSGMQWESLQTYHLIEALQVSLFNHMKMVSELQQFKAVRGKKNAK